MANPSDHAATFMPYPFRPFWQPNSRAFSPSVLHQDVRQLERLTQKLDIAEKKIDEYARLIASLYAELKRYQDVICHTCRMNISCATLATAPPPTPTGFNQSASHIASASKIPTCTVSPGQICTTSGVHAAIEGPAASSLGSHDRLSRTSQSSRIHSPGPGGNTNPDSLIVTSSSTDNPPVSIPNLPSTAIPTTSPYSTDADFKPLRPPFPPISDPATIADPTQANPDYSVEYNSKIQQNFRLHVASSFTFTASVLCAKFSRDGKYLAVGLENGETHIHNIVTGSKSVLAERSAKVFYTEAAEAPSEIWAVRFSQDNKHIATGGKKGQINIWEIHRRRVRAIFRHKELVGSLEFSSDGRFLVSASHDESVCMWSMRDGSRRRLWHGASIFTSVAFSPDGRFVAAGSIDGLLRIWDTCSGQLVAKWGGHNDCVRSVIFTSDGEGIASGGDTLKCWDFGSLRTNRHPERRIIEDDTTTQLNQIFEFKEHKYSITAVSFSSDHRWAASSSLDHNVCILDARTGAWVLTLKAHTDRIWAADFSPAGPYIVLSGGQDFRVRIWRYEIVE